MRDIAGMLKVTPQAIREAETKGTGLDKGKWYQLADFFDKDPRWLESPDVFSP